MPESRGDLVAESTGSVPQPGSWRICFLNALWGISVFFLVLWATLEELNPISGVMIFVGLPVNAFFLALLFSTCTWGFRAGRNPTPKNRLMSLRRNIFMCIALIFFNVWSAFALGKASSGLIMTVGFLPCFINIRWALGRGLRKSPG